ncbi:MAG: GWxTD domain-containing protein [Marinoscillum sp.]
MQRTRKALLSLLFSLMCLVVYSIDLSKINLSYQYMTDTELRMSHRVVDSGLDLSVYFEVTTKSLEGWSKYFLLQEKYNSVEHDTLTNYTLDTISVQERRTLFKLTFRKPQRSLLIIAWANLSSGLYRIEDVRVKNPVGFPSYLPVNGQGDPIISNYVLHDSVLFEGSSGNFHVFRYQDNFGPADPAMGLMKQIAPNLDIDSSFYFDQTLGSMIDYRFYLVQTDTLAQTAITLLKCPPYYPELRRIEELIPPLTYITTAAEIKSLKDMYSRKAFEDFWINTYASKFRAKAAIKSFYNQVETVNLLFTDYKQGWKTDRGMIYLIFGPPLRVFRSERNEVWEYLDGTEFEFIRISTLFTPSMYSLKRSRDYEDLWYERVGEIRRGL